MLPSRQLRVTSWGGGPWSNLPGSSMTNASGTGAVGPSGQQVMNGPHAKSKQFRRNGQSVAFTRVRNIELGSANTSFLRRSSRSWLAHSPGDTLQDVLRRILT